MGSLCAAGVPRIGAARSGALLIRGPVLDAPWIPALRCIVKNAAPRPGHDRGPGPHNPGSAVMVTLIVPAASAITRSVLESKAMSARFRLVISAATRTPFSFF